MCLSMVTCTSHAALVRSKAKELHERQVELNDLEKVIESNLTKIKNNEVTAADLPNQFVELAQLYEDKSVVLKAMTRLKYPRLPEEELDFRASLQAKKMSTDVLQKFISRFPKDKNIEMVSYQYALKQAEMGLAEKAIFDFNAFLEKYPQSKHQDQVLYYLGNYYYFQNQYSQAQSYLSRLEQFPSSSYYVLGLFKQGVILKNQKQFLKAKEYFVKILTILQQHPQWKTTFYDLTKTAEPIGFEIEKESFLALIECVIQSLQLENTLAMLRELVRLTSNPWVLMLGFEKLVHGLDLKNDGHQILAVKIYFQLLQISPDSEVQMSALTNLLTLWTSLENMEKVVSFEQIYSRLVDLSVLNASPEWNSKIDSIYSSWLELHWSWISTELKKTESLRYLSDLELLQTQIHKYSILFSSPQKRIIRLKDEVQKKYRELLANVNSSLLSRSLPTSKVIDHGVFIKEWTKKLAAIGDLAKALQIWKQLSDTEELVRGYWLSQDWDGLIQIAEWGTATQNVSQDIVIIMDRWRYQFGLAYYNKGLYAQAIRYFAATNSSESVANSFYEQMLWLSQNQDPRVQVLGLYQLAMLEEKNAFTRKNFKPSHSIEKDMMNISSQQKLLKRCVEVSEKFAIYNSSSFKCVQQLYKKINKGPQTELNMVSKNTIHQSVSLLELEKTILEGITTSELNIESNKESNKALKNELQSEVKVDLGLVGLHYALTSNWEVAAEYLQQSIKDNPKNIFGLYGLKYLNEKFHYQQRLADNRAIIKKYPRPKLVISLGL